MVTERVRRRGLSRRGDVSSETRAVSRAMREVRIVLVWVMVELVGWSGAVDFGSVETRCPWKTSFDRSITGLGSVEEVRPLSLQLH